MESARGVKPRATGAIGWAIATATLAIALCIVYAALGMWRYRIFRAGVDDGAFTQIVAGIGHGFSSTLEYNLNHLLVHCSPILVLAYPFVRLLGGAPGLIVLQAIVVSATIVPVYALAQSRMPRYAAFGVAVVAALYPPLSGEGIGDFHELAFAPPLAAGMVWAIETGRWRWAVAFALVLATVKEDVLLGLTFVGTVVALSSKGLPAKRTCGIAIGLIGAVGALLYFAVLRPLLNPGVPYWSLHYYAWWTSPPTPDGFVALNSPMRLRYLGDALAPLLFIPVFSRYALFAIPGFLEVLASHEGITYAIGAQYSATWSGYLLCAFADGVGVLWRHSKLVASYSLIGAAILAIRYNRFDSPVGPGYFLYRSPNRADAALEARLQRLPRGASIAASDDLFAHLGDDPQASIRFACQEYVVLDRRSDGPHLDGAGASLAKTLLGNGVYAVASDRAGILVLKRTPKACNPALR